MVKKTILLAALLAMTAGPAVADYVESLSNQDLKYVTRDVQDEMRRHDNLLSKLKSAGRSSSNSSRKSVVNDLNQAMADVVFEREELLGQEHTIMRHNTYTESGTTDAAEVGAPVGTRGRNRRVRVGMEDQYPEALQRLARMQSLLVTAKRIEVQAIEKQGEAFEKYSQLARDFGEVILTERNILMNEQTRREEAAAEKAEAQENPEGSDSN